MLNLRYIKNGFGCWYTCMLYSGMEPTNNLGEQAMREHVIIRKIIGCFRSENGAENYQYIASLLATCRLQGKNGFEELEKVLRQELCLTQLWVNFTEKISKNTMLRANEPKKQLKNCRYTSKFGILTSVFWIFPQIWGQFILYIECMWLYLNITSIDIYFIKKVYTYI